MFQIETDQYLTPHSWHSIKVDLQIVDTIVSFISQFLIFLKIDLLTDVIETSKAGGSGIISDRYYHNI